MRWISVEYVLELQRQRAEINKLNLKDIIWTEGGEDLEIAPEVIADFEFTGLSNEHFITTNYYKKGFTEYND